jgi:tRNA modification GTPase
MTKQSPYVQDTIVARATPAGMGGVAIVRISGAEVENIAVKMLGSLPPPRHAELASFGDDSGSNIDTGVALYFPGPNSFTGESVLELHGHGGPIVVSLIVEAAIALGARAARPGEFSKRAFLNDKLDLVQAEAIADLIGSGTKQAARAALRSLSGGFSTVVDALEEQLVRLRLHVEAAIDFPEEEIDFLSDQQLLDRIDESDRAFVEIRRTADIGRVLRDGFQIVIVGKPNVGKSSLLNLLSGEDAAIVTDVAGTTRDILREQIKIDGLTVELVDTAGLRSDPDQIEAEGIRRAKEALKSADAALWIQDATQADEEHQPDASLPEDLPVLVVRNKTDLTDEMIGRDKNEPPTIRMSAKTGAGLSELTAAIKALAGYSELGEGAFTARQRHVDALERAQAHFLRGRQALEDTKSGELLAEELRLSQQALGEITGAISSDDLLGRIFSEFCIGK